MNEDIKYFIDGFGIQEETIKEICSFNEIELNDFIDELLRDEANFNNADVTSGQTCYGYEDMKKIIDEIKNYNGDIIK